MTATHALEEFGLAESAMEAKRNITEAIRAAAAKLGNTPAICRSCYVHPGVLEAYKDGALLAEDRRLPASADEIRGLRAEEARVLALLRHVEEQAYRRHEERQGKAS